MPFYDREKEIREMKAILSGEPNLVYFVYGPINSGKTTLLTRVFEELPENYQVFYINFRGRYVVDINDLLQVLFEVKRGEYLEDIKEIVKEFLKEGARAIRKFKGIPIPERIFDIIFGERKVENIFKYLEDVFEEIKGSGDVPVFVLDEMQSIKEVINAVGRPVVSELFNFLVRLTKETHLCHCLCATSDYLFIEDVYSNARLEGRARYVLVDDLQKEEAFRVYEEFGFEDKELVWDYIGGKVGDMVILYEWKKQGYGEDEALKEMLRNEEGRLGWIKLTKLRKRQDGGDLWRFLAVFKKADFLSKAEIEEDFDKLLFWIEENVLFYNPLRGTVRPQGRLIQRAIGKIVK